MFTIGRHAVALVATVGALPTVGFFRAYEPTVNPAYAGRINRGCQLTGSR
jgi:hypothetical protein